MLFKKSLFFASIFFCLLGRTIGQKNVADTFVGKWFEIMLISTEECNLDNLYIDNFKIEKATLDSVFNDTLIVDSTSVFYMVNNWDYEFLSDGTYSKNDSGYCDIGWYKPSGTWTYKSKRLKLNGNRYCSGSGSISETIGKIHMYSPTVFYECIKEQKNGPFYILFYKKIPTIK